MQGMGFPGWPMLVLAAAVLAILVGLALLILALRRPVKAPFRPPLDESLSRSFEPDLAMAAPKVDVDAEAREVEAVVVIPDISGYTRFISLNRFSLGHAQYLLSQLLNEIIDTVAERLRVAKVEGDAVLFYAERGGGNGQPLDVGAAVNDLLTAFYRRRRELAESNACSCAACSNLEKLDLKVVVAAGPILVYRLRGLREISGHPVIVAHRLLKNSLALSRYVLVAEEARDQVRLPWSPEGREHRERYDDIGEVVSLLHEVEPEALVAGRAAAKPGYGSLLADAGAKLKRSVKTLTSEAASP